MPCIIGKTILKVNAYYILYDQCYTPSPTSPSNSVDPEIKTTKRILFHICNCATYMYKKYNLKTKKQEIN